MHDLIAKIATTGGRLTRVGRSWFHAGDEIVQRHDVRRLAAHGYLAVKNGRARLTKKALEMIDSTARGPAFGVEVTYRRRKATGRGRVLFATSTKAILVPSGPLPTPARLVIVRRPSGSAPWKESTTDAVGAWRPPHTYEAEERRVVWARIAAWPGLIPEGWDAPPEGQRYTLARMASVVSRLDAIGARPHTDEEYAADSLFSSSLFSGRHNRQPQWGSIASKTASWAPVRVVDGPAVVDYLAEVAKRYASEVWAARVADARADVRRVLYYLHEKKLRAAKSAAEGRRRAEGAGSDWRRAWRKTMDAPITLAEVRSELARDRTLSTDVVEAAFWAESAREAYRYVEWCAEHYSSFGRED